MSHGSWTVIEPEVKPRGRINPDGVYKFVLLGDRDNLDGTRDFVVRLTGVELQRLLDLVRGK
jgi:hypothetical protein